MAEHGTDNSNEALKLEVREWLASHFDEWRVLDLYCGEQGRMYQGIWSRAAEYFGVDKFRPHKLAVTARMSAERAAQQLRLDDYNLYDLDCYDSPWGVARTILRRRGPGRFGLAMTSGEERGLKNGHSNEIIRRTIGASGLSDLRLLGRYQDLVVGLMLRSLAELPGVQLVAAAKAETARHIIYLGGVFDKESGKC